MPPVALDAANCPDAPLVAAAKRAWDRALALGEQHGFRNAQVSVIAPTGTIGLVMDCDTTGIEPDFALVKFKKLAGGGYFKIINQTVPLALRDPGLRRGGDRRASSPMRSATARSQGAPAINHETLAARGFDAATLERVEKSLATAFDIRFAFSRYTLGDDFCRERARPRRRGARRSQARRAGAPRLLPERHRGGEHPRLRDDVARGRTRSQARTSRGVRLCESLWTRWHALLVCGESHTHDGCSTTVHIGRDLQNHQHAQRRYGRGLPQGLRDVVEAWSEGQCSLSRRLEAFAAALGDGARRRRRRQRRPRRHDARRARADHRRAHRRTDRRARSARAAASACRSGARATRRRPSSAGTRSICAPANTRTAGSARSSSTCTRKAPPSAA